MTLDEIIVGLKTSRETAKFAIYDKVRVSDEGINEYYGKDAIIINIDYTLANNDFVYYPIYSILIPYIDEEVAYVNLRYPEHMLEKIENDLLEI